MSKFNAIHALTNRIYVVTANRIGIEGDLTFTGLSTVANPQGDVLIQASPEEEEVSITNMDIDLARNKDITARNNLFGDRRPQEYAFLLK